MNYKLKKLLSRDNIMRYLSPTTKVSGKFHFDERCLAMVGNGLYELVLGHITTDDAKKIHIWGPQELRDYDGMNVKAVLDRRYIADNLYVDSRKVKRYAALEPFKKDDQSGVVDYFEHRESLEKKVYITHLS